jgi:WD40 repeat protein
MSLNGVELQGQPQRWPVDHGVQGHQRAVRAVTVTGDGHAITGSMDGTAIVWDIESGQALHTLTGHHSGVWAVAATSDGHAITGSDDGTAIVWDLARGRAVASWYADHAVTAVGWSKRQSVVATGDVGGGVHVLRLKI